jgi:hypothetical protein
MYTASKISGYHAGDNEDRFFNTTPRYLAAPFSTLMIEVGRSSRT